MAKRSGQSIEPKDLVSLITYNSGSLWSPIRGPSRDEEGRNISDCAELQDSIGGCSLHLAQQLSKKVAFYACIKKGIGEWGSDRNF
jgi:hypothetical protein